MDEIIEVGNDSYSYMMGLWSSSGYASMIENQADGWMYAVVFPNGPDTPVFSLVCHSSGSTTVDKDSGVTGYGLEMVAKRMSIGNRNGILAREPIDG